MQKLTRSLLAVGAVIGLAACGDDVTVTPPTPPPAPTVTGVTVSPASTTIKIGESVTFSASLQTTGTVSNTAVTWSSADPVKASVSASGAVLGLAVGTTTIRATSAANPSASGAGSVTVVAPGVLSVSVTPSAATLAVGQSFTAVANVTRDANVLGTVTWLSSAATIASVTSAGVVTGVTPGTAVITATSTADVTKSASLSVTVNQQANALQSLTVTPGSIAVGPGGSVTLTTITQAATGATVSFANSTSNPAAATVTATGANAVVTGVSNGTAVITITATGTGPGLVTNSISQTVTVNIAAASVSISSLTSCILPAAGPPCVVTPINYNAVAGQVEATLNLFSGSQVIDSVAVFIDAVEAGSQVFGVNGAPNAPVTLSVRTSGYYGPTGANAFQPFFINGPHTIIAKIFPHGSASPTASNTVQITLANKDIVYFDASTGTTANGPGLNHLGTSACQVGSSPCIIWWVGGFTFTAHAVNYSGQISSITYNSSAVCGSVAGTPEAVSGSAVPSTFPATFTCAGTEGGQSIGGAISVAYPPTYTLTTGPTAFVTTTDPAFQQSFINFAYNGPNGVPATLEDNKGPTLNPVIITAPGFGGWHGSPTTYSGTASDAGVGISSTSGWQVDATTNGGLSYAFPNITGALNLPVTLVPLPYQVATGGNAVDVLGNGTTGHSSLSSVFGVDLTVTDAQYSNRAATPVLAGVFPIASIGTIYTGAAWTAQEAVAQYMAVDAIDLQGSGLNNPDALTQSLVRYNPGGASACLSGTYPMNTVLSDNYVQGNSAGPAEIDCGLAASARTGRYTWTASVKDRAGNSLKPFQGSVSSTTPLDSVYVLIDEGTPQMAGIGPQSALYTGGAPAFFTFSANDDYELKDGQISLTYCDGSPTCAGNLPPTITYPYGSTAYSTGSFSASPWDNTYVNVLNGQALTLGYMLGNIDQVTAFGVVAGFTSSGIVNAVTASVRDWAGQTSGSLSSNILSTNVGPTPGVAWASSSMATWKISVVGANSITVQQIGASSTSTASCTRIDIYQADALAPIGPISGAVDLKYIASQSYTPSSVPFTDNGFNRFFNYTVALTTNASGKYTAACVAGGRGLFSELL